ncbi:MAG: FHA domain-containing protein [Bradymonadaceae bacterium]
MSKQTILWYRSILNPTGPQSGPIFRAYRHLMSDSDDITRARPSADRKGAAEDRPFPFPTHRSDDVFASIDVDAPPERANPEARRENTPDSAPAGPRPSSGGREPIARMTVRAAERTSQTIPVHPPRFIIGRDNADLVLDDEFTSPWHAQLFVDDNVLVLEDMSSYNGVFLRIADELVLEDRDELVMGQQRFVFRQDWEEPSHGDAPDLDVPRLGAPLAGSPVRLFQIMTGGRIRSIFNVGDGVTIGGEGCEVSCPEDFSLSSPHAEIVRDGETFILRDLDSEFGTFIRIHDTVEVVDGDCFVVGRTRLDLNFM